MLQIEKNPLKSGSFYFLSDKIGTLTNHDIKQSSWLNCYIVIGSATWHAPERKPNGRDIRIMRDAHIAVPFAYLSLSYSKFEWAENMAVQARSKKLSGKQICCATKWFLWKLDNLSHLYKRVASSNTSCLEPHPDFYGLLMKRIFDAYVLWLFDKKCFLNL